MIRAKNAYLNPARRSDFILWTMANSDKTIARIISEGDIEVLGGFDIIPPSPHPGWMLKVVSKNNKVYHLVVSMNQTLWTLVPWRLWSGDVPWEYYNGNPHGNKWTIFDGDKPREYSLNKVRAIREHRKKISKT